MALKNPSYPELVHLVKADTEDGMFKFWGKPKHSINKKAAVKGDDGTWSSEFIEHVLKEWKKGLYTLDEAVLKFGIPKAILKSYHICHFPTEKFESVCQQQRMSDAIKDIESKKYTFEFASQIYNINSKTLKVVYNQKHGNFKEYWKQYETNFLLTDTLIIFRKFNTSLTPIEILEKYVNQKSIRDSCLKLKMRRIRVKLIKSALSAVEMGILSVSRATKVFKISDTMLNYHIALKHDMNYFVKIYTVFNQYSKFMESHGYILTKKVIMDYIKNLIENETNFQLEYSQEVIKIFCFRFVKAQKAKLRTHYDYLKMSVDEVYSQFHYSLFRVLLRNKLLTKPFQIFSSGEVKLPLKFNDYKDDYFITVNSCVSATGQCLPFQIVFPEKFRLNINKEIIHGTSTVGTMNSSLYMKWFDYFLRHCGEARPVILIQNNFRQYLNRALILKAIKNDIILFNVSDDVECLSPVHRIVLRPVSEWYLANCDLITGENFLNLLFNRVEEDMTISNIISEFKLCGVYPFSNTCGTKITSSEVLKNRMYLNLNVNKEVNFWISDDLTNLYLDKGELVVKWMGNAWETSKDEYDMGKITLPTSAVSAVLSQEHIQLKEKNKAIILFAGNGKNQIRKETQESLANTLKLTEESPFEVTVIDVCQLKSDKKDMQIETANKIQLVDKKLLTGEEEELEPCTESKKKTEKHPIDVSTEESQFEIRANGIQLTKVIERSELKLEKAIQKGTDTSEIEFRTSKEITGDERKFKSAMGEGELHKENSVKTVINKRQLKSKIDDRHLNKVIEDKHLTETKDCQLKEVPGESQIKSMNTRKKIKVGLIDNSLNNKDAVFSIDSRSLRSKSGAKYLRIDRMRVKSKCKE